MSNNRNRSKPKAPQAEKTAMCANDIPANTAMMHVIATNLMTIAFADVPDAPARIAKARRQIISEQPNVTISMRRLLERSEGYVLSALKQVNRDKKKVH